MKKMLIFGGSGYIGRSLIALLSQSYHVIIVTRSVSNASELSQKNVELFEWNYKEEDKIFPLIADCFAVINLVGENISSKRWTKNQKQKILNSRLSASSLIVKIINSAEIKPRVYIQGSAIGYYDYENKTGISEADSKGAGFMADVVDKWEKVSDTLESKNVRKILIRTGVVIGKNSILIKRLEKTFKSRIGGHLGNGKQYISWIHIDDHINAVKFLLENPDLSGKYNLTAPKPVTMKDFCIQFGSTINRKSWFHVPKIIMKIIFGQMAIEILINGSEVLPKRLTEASFEFKYKDIEPAFCDIMSANTD